jgi:hypothetical protein
MYDVLDQITKISCKEQDIQSFCWNIIGLLENLKEFAYKVRLAIKKKEFPISLLPNFGKCWKDLKNQRYMGIKLDVGPIDIYSVNDPDFVPEGEEHKEIQDIPFGTRMWNPFWGQLVDFSDILIKTVVEKLETQLNELSFRDMRDCLDIGTILASFDPISKLAEYDENFMVYDHGKIELKRIIKDIDLPNSDLAGLTEELLLAEYDLFKRRIYAVLRSQHDIENAVNQYVKDWKTVKKVGKTNTSDWEAAKTFESFTKDCELYEGIENFLWFYEYCYSICHVECTCETVASKMKLHSHNRTISPETMKKETIIDWQFFKPGEHADKFLGQVIDLFLRAHTTPIVDIDGISPLGSYFTRSKVILRKKNEAKSRLGSIINELERS